MAGFHYRLQFLQKYAKIQFTNYLLSVQCYTHCYLWPSSEKNGLAKVQFQLIFHANSGQTKHLALKTLEENVSTLMPRQRLRRASTRRNMCLPHKENMASEILQFIYLEVMYKIIGVV